MSDPSPQTPPQTPAAVGLTASDAAAPLILLLPLGLLVGLVEWPYQLLSELGFRLQQGLWGLQPLARGAVAASLTPKASGNPVAAGALLVFVASAALLLLAWGPLSWGRGGGVAPLLALDRCGDGIAPEQERDWHQKLDLGTQLLRLPLLLLTHLGGLAVGVESPSAALGAGLLLALRQRLGSRSPLARLPLPLLAVVGGAAGLGAAFRSPLLGVIYGLEELGRRNGLPLILPTLLLAGSGSLVATRLGQPARLPGLNLGVLPPHLLGWAAALSLAGLLLGALLVRLLIAFSAWIEPMLIRHRLPIALLLAAALSACALASRGLSLNDGSLSLAAALQGGTGGDQLTPLWRLLATLLSVAAGAPGGLMHDAMTLGALLVDAARPLLALPAAERAQLAAVGATALFAAANGTPLFCAVFVFTLQGNPASLPLLLLVSGLCAGFGEPLRGEGWNGLQLSRLLRSRPSPIAARR